MKFSSVIRLQEAAQFLGCDYVGAPDHPISGVNEIHRVEPGDVVFVDVEKYFQKAFDSAATTILINKKVEAPAGKGLLVTDDPFRDFNRLSLWGQPARDLNTQGQPSMGKDVKIGQNVVFGEGVVLEDGVQIGHNSVIGSQVHIGANTMIHANVSIYDHCQIGKDCCINAGSVIGSEAFYFKARPYGRDKMISVGRVIIEDHVDIGSNCSIDRGVTADTIIGEYTKLDNLVQVGHDTVIGKKCLIASQVGIAGVVTVEDEVALWGQVGVVQDLTIGKGATLLGKTGVMSDLEGGKAYGGMVADDARSFLRKEAMMKRLLEIMPDIEKMLKNGD